MSEETPKREFAGVWIPARIWLDGDLSWMEKCLLAEIDSLDPGNGCFASNEFLAKRFGSTEASIANILSRFRKLELIHDRGFDGRKRRISCVHSSRGQVKAALTHRLTQPQPTGEPCINDPVNIDTSVGIRREKIHSEDKSSAVDEGKKEALKTLSIRIGSILKRRPSTLWTPKEKKALSVLFPVPEEDIKSIERYYSASLPAAKDYRRQTILTLLNNWPGEVDRATRHLALASKPRENPICG